MINSEHPIFQYHISGIPGVITEDSPLRQLPLMGKDAGGILIHEYFDLAKQFIQSQNYGALKEGVKLILNSECSIDSLTQIDIYLEKHGVFYHPARIEVTTQDRPSIIFVLNTAVSSHGLAIINREYKLLKYLNELDKHSFLPKVFGVGTLDCRGMQISFFLATWFDGYKEFHLTDNVDKSGALHINLWNSDGSTITIPPPAYFEIYEKASEILTFFYNIKTFKHISPWHHAAGDFITKPTQYGFDVKLITTRGYSGIVDTDPFETDEAHYSNTSCYNEEHYDIEDIHKALFLFFLNLTLRMRIDRIDGTKEYCMVDARVIPFILKGFFRALEKKAENDSNKIFFRSSSDYTVEKKGVNKKASGSEPSFVDGFKSYLIQFDHNNLYDIFLVMTESPYPDSPENLFILKNLRSHSEILLQYLRNIIASIP